MAVLWDEVAQLVNTDVLTVPILIWRGETAYPQFALICLQPRRCKVAPNVSYLRDRQHWPDWGWNFKARPGDFERANRRQPIFAGAGSGFSPAC